MVSATGAESATAILRPKPMEEAATTDLIRRAVEDAQALVRVEVRLAVAEVEKQARDAARAAIGAAVAAGSGLVATAMICVAIVLAAGASAAFAAIFAVAFLIAGAIAAFLAYRWLPRNPLAETRRRLEDDIEQLKEHVV